MGLCFELCVLNIIYLGKGSEGTRAVSLCSTECRGDSETINNWFVSSVNEKAERLELTNDAVNEQTNEGRKSRRTTWAPAGERANHT
jgi:hypothetical protein